MRKPLICLMVLFALFSKGNMQDEYYYDESYYYGSYYDEQYYDGSYYDESFYDESYYDGSYYDEQYYDGSYYDEYYYDEQYYDESYYDESQDDATQDETYYDDETYDNDETAQDDEDYQNDETYPDETYPDETYPDETYPDETYPDETQQDDPNYNDEANYDNLDENDETYQDETQYDQNQDETQQDQNQDETQQDQNQDDETNNDSNNSEETQSDQTYNDESYQDEQQNDQTYQDEIQDVDTDQQDYPTVIDEQDESDEFDESDEYDESDEQTSQEEKDEDDKYDEQESRSSNTQYSNQSQVSTATFSSAELSTSDIMQDTESVVSAVKPKEVKNILCDGGVICLEGSGTCATSNSTLRTYCACKGDKTGPSCDISFDTDIQTKIDINLDIAYNRETLQMLYNISSNVQLTWEQIPRLITNLRQSIHQTKKVKDIEYSLKAIEQMAQKITIGIDDDQVSTYQRSLQDAIQEASFRALTLLKMKDPSTNFYFFSTDLFNVAIADWKSLIIGTGSIQGKDVNLPLCVYNQPSILIQFEVRILLSNKMISGLYNDPVSYGVYCSYLDQTGTFTSKPTSLHSYIVILPKQKPTFSNQTLGCFEVDQHQLGFQINKKTPKIEYDDSQIECQPIDDNHPNQDYVTCKCNHPGLILVKPVEEVSVSSTIILKVLTLCYLATVSLLIM